MKKIFLILAVLLMTDLIAAKENRTVKLNSGFNKRRTQERASRVFDKQKLADTIQLNSGFEMPVLTAFTPSSSAESGNILSSSSSFSSST